MHRPLIPTAARALTAALLTFVLLLLAGSPVMAVEEPPFETVLSDPPFELRRYPGFVVAETLVEGGFDDASRTGFRRVAGYIFGGNRDARGQSQRIAMTAPVTVEPDAGRWRLHFVMPPGTVFDTLPRPEDERVRLRQVDEHRMVAVRFSGFTTDASMRRETQRLRDWAAGRGLTLTGEPQVARYNDPFTLPWRRRNEILIRVAP